MFQWHDCSDLSVLWDESQVIPGWESKGVADFLDKIQNFVKLGWRYYTDLWVFSKAKAALIAVAAVPAAVAIVGEIG